MNLFTFSVKKSDLLLFIVPKNNLISRVACHSKGLPDQSYAHVDQKLPRLATSQSYEKFYKIFIFNFAASFQSYIFHHTCTSLIFHSLKYFYYSYIFKAKLSSCQGAWSDVIEHISYYMRGSMRFRVRAHKLMPELTISCNHSDLGIPQVFL